MNSSREHLEIVDRFAVVARQFCTIVDAASSLSRKEFLTQVYSILPKLIDQAIGLPAVAIESGDDEPLGLGEVENAARHGQPEWQRRYILLKELFGDWDCYQLVFNPVGDREPICGSLGDDLADIYRDLNEVLAERESGSVSPEDQIWKWRFLFSYHWGKHAVDALSAVYWRLERNET